MEDVQFSDEFCAFLQSVIPSVDAAELLLYVADRPDAWWRLDDVVRKLRPAVNITDADAARYLASFRDKGLIEAGADGAFRWNPASPLAAHVRTLAQAYEERPVTLIRVIYALRDDRIRTFAEAFRLRKK